MTNFKKIVLFLILSLSALLFFSCGEKVCEHPADSMKVTRVEATCTADGFSESECGLCGLVLHETLPATGHELKEEKDEARGLTEKVCSKCQKRYLFVPGEGTLRLTGFFGGDVSFDMEPEYGTAEGEMKIDGVSVSRASLAAGQAVTVTASELAMGQHTLEFVNSGKQELMITPKTLDGHFNRAGALLLEVLPTANGADYSSFHIWIQTSDPSGDYYVCYKMVYEQNDVRDNYGVNSCTNISNYRLRTAQLVKVTSVTDTAVRGTKITELLNTGEVSLAIRQSDPDMSALQPGAVKVLEERGNFNNAGDFIGGYHGDEWIETVSLSADGEPIRLDRVKTAMVLPCTVLTFDQTTTLYAWGTSSTSDHGTAVALHSQNFVIDSNGFDNLQTVQWLSSDFSVNTNATYLQMFPLLRSGNGIKVSNFLEAFDENGVSIGSFEILDSPISADFGVLNDARTRLLRYSGPDGIAAETGFTLHGDNVRVTGTWVSVRKDSINDNKFYASFASVENGKTPHEGEIWEVGAHYHIDYIRPGES